MSAYSTHSTTLRGIEGRGNPIKPLAELCEGKFRGVSSQSNLVFFTASLLVISAVSRIDSPSLFSE